MKQALIFFEQAIKKERMSHLYLLYGLKGSGKLELALEVAYLILKDKDVSNDILRLQIQERKSPNVMVIEPDGQTIKKEQIIALQQEFSKTSLVKGPRVYIISHIDKMTQSAANSLLKFMEEPSNKGVYGFLLTENKDAVISTILSRSQIIALKSMDEQTLKEALIKEQVDIEMASFVPYLTKNLDEAIRMSMDPNYVELMLFMKEFSATWQKKNQPLVLFFMKSSKLLTYDRAFFKSFLELILLYFLDLVYYKTHQPIVLEFLKEDIQHISSSMSIQQIEVITRHIKDLLKRQNYYINLDMALDHLAYVLDQSR
jgi:DNA polymerase III subunit delta'